MSCVFLIHINILFDFPRVKIIQLKGYKCANERKLKDLYFTLDIQKKNIWMCFFDN